MIRFGPAGWSYKDWAGIVYPAPKPAGFDPLGFLAGFFDTIEINSTFYGPATPESARRWIDRVAPNPDFRFTAKLWRRFTHQRAEAWTRSDVDQAKASLLPLHAADRLGAVLLQFPWSFRNDEENRAWLEDVTHAFEEFPLVVEVRHLSWNEPDFFAELRERGIGFANIDQPQFHDSIAPSATRTSPVGYIRVHGRNYRDWWRDSAAPHERYDYLYSAEELRPWARRVKEIEAEGAEEVYVVTNNHYKGKAPANALMLQAMVIGRKVESPAPLIEAYADVLEAFAKTRKPKGDATAAKADGPVKRPRDPGSPKRGADAGRGGKPATGASQRSRRRKPVSSKEAGSSRGSR